MDNDGEITDLSLFAQIKSGLNGDVQMIAEFNGAISEIQRVVEIHGTDGLMLSFGKTDGIAKHVMDRELKHSFFTRFFRDVFMFGGDHRPTMVSGTPIVLEDGNGNKLKTSWFGDVHSVRVGDGWHFHNISTAFTFFHQDPDAPTSFGGMIAHGIEFVLNYLKR